MKKVFILSLMLLALVSCREKKSNLIWSDEFNYQGLPDSSKWVYDTGYIANEEQQYYTERRIENANVSGGSLMLIGKKEQVRNFNYTSARIKTDGIFDVKYGRIEARMKLPVGQGMWPAFWMLGANIHKEGWPECGEIDIMEHINTSDTIYGTAHWENEGHVSSGGNTTGDVSQFHNYAVEWNQDSIHWLLDGKRYYGMNIKDGIDSTSAFHKPFFIILNLAIGGMWPGNPDSTTVFPDTVYVDYVRVFKNSR
jgi:beta-glucanase (GH16 family)